MTTTPSASPTTFLGKAHSPYLQAATAAGMILLLLGFGELLRLGGSEGFGERMPWIMTTAVMLLYALFNSIFCLASKNALQYWNQSVISYILLAIFGGLLAWWASGLSINQAGTFRWLFFVVSFAYLVFISIVNLIRIIVSFAQKEEWNAPRARRK